MSEVDGSQRFYGGRGVAETIAPTSTMLTPHKIFKLTQRWLGGCGWAATPEARQADGLKGRRSVGRIRSRRRRRSRGRDWIRGGVLSPRAGWGTLKRSMCCLFSLPPAAPFLAIRRLRSFASYLSTLVKVAWHFTVVMSTYVYVCVLVSCSLCLCLCVCASFSLSHCSCVCVCVCVRVFLPSGFVLTFLLLFSLLT